MVLGARPWSSAAAIVLYRLFPHVRLRVDVWLDPAADPLGSGYQVLRALYAFGRGGIVGTGLGAGPAAGGRTLAIPLLHSDFAFAALGEELGLAGAVAICALLPASSAVGAAHRGAGRR